MKRSIFISRSLTGNSLLLAFLQENDWEFHGQSLIHVEPIPFRIDAEFDWIFIASSNGAKILLNSYSIPETTKVGVVGEATAKAVKNFGIFPDFIGKTGNMNELGDLLARTIGRGSVLFVGADGGSEKIRSAIPANQRTFLPIYRTILKDDIDIPETEIVYLTSPSNAKSYSNNASLKGKTVIAIGHTTADFLAVQGIRNVLIPASPKEEDVIKLLRGI
ncbi:MAG: uroporphyrinogen-III synthase [Flavobacteriales bacterium]|nr:uroporphyrinogen-III synthase [Flavobacteriales bacterium]